MPLKKGKSKETVSENISEFHQGPTYAKTKSKFGKERADRQAVAVAMSEKRKSAGGARKRKPAKTASVKASGKK